MSINRLLNAIETEFKSTLNTAKTCEQFPGPFTVQTVVGRSFTSPAVFMGTNGGQAPRSEDEAMLNQFGAVTAARFTAITVGKHAKSERQANAEAMLLAEQIAVLVHRNNFDQGFAQAAYNVRIEPLAAGKDNKSGHLCFWRITWWHGVAINSEHIEAQWALIENFDGYDADHYLPDADIQTDAPKMKSQEQY